MIRHLFERKQMNGKGAEIQIKPIIHKFLTAGLLSTHPPVCEL